MKMRKTVTLDNAQKVFAPEAYGDFPIVAAAKIEKLKKDIAPELAGKTWELTADMI